MKPLNMKNIYILILTLFCLGTGTISAQYPYPHLLSFNDTNGRNPYGSLTISGNVLYGMTSRGGAKDKGCIFSIHTNGNGYKKLLDFDSANGAHPWGSLTLIGNKLFGMTGWGGAYNNGCIFSIDTNGFGYKDIFDFNGANGAVPVGDLIFSGDTLYGMTGGGGANSDGCIFSLDTNGTNYKDLFDFNGTNGNEPEGDLILSGNTLYGMTPHGGANDEGLIFSININGSGFKDMLDFNGTNGELPYGSLILSGSTLYGLTYTGGATGAGNIFSIDTTGSNYNIIFNFNGTNGGGAMGSLIRIGSSLYGLTSQGGGIWPYGCMFSIDTNGSEYKILLHFNGDNGVSPQGSLIFSGGVFYGMTENGGPSGSIYGVVFDYMSLRDSIISVSNKCFGDSNGSVTVMAFGDDPSDSPAYSYNWGSGWTSSNTISGLPAGKYKVTIKDNITNDTITDSVTIITPSSPLVINTSSTLSACNSNNGSASVIVSGGTPPYMYSWSPITNTNSTITGLALGNDTCIITDSSGCVKTAMFTIRDSGTLKVSLISYTPALKCPGDSNGSAVVSISGGTKPYRYLWSPSGGTDTVAQNLVAATYTFTVTDTNGCRADTLVHITQPAPLKIIATAWPDDEKTCNGITWVKVSGGTIPYNYLWSSGQTIDSITKQCPGNYCCTVTDSHGCFDSACMTVDNDTTTGVLQLMANDEKIIIYPNPSNGIFTIEQSAEKQIGVIEVYNVLGEKVFKSSFSAPRFTLDLSGQPAGIYFYRITAEDGKCMGSGKLVKE
jgi:uncharacterized repeat protein (TIGR03803 family)